MSGYNHGHIPSLRTVPKDNYLIQLNLKREVNRRLSFVKKRMKETPSEFRYFNGITDKLPKSIAAPPEWARDAATIAWNTGTGVIFKKFTAETIRSDPRGFIREVSAVFEAMRSYVLSPQIDKDASLELNEATKELHHSASRLVAKKYILKLNKLYQLLDSKLPPLTPQQLVEHADRCKKALRATVSDRGELFESRSTLNQIYNVVWFFWPIINQCPKLSAADMHTWLGRELGIFTSIKTVEIVHTKLKLTSRFNARP